MLTLIHSGGSAGNCCCQRRVWRHDSREDPPAERHDEAGLLGDGDEVIRQHQPAFRVLPAHQRFEPHDASGPERHDRLVVHQEIAAVDAAPQVGLELEQGHRALVHVAVEDLVAGLALGLGAVHRDVGVAQDLLGVGVAGRAVGDTDRGGHQDIVPVDREVHAQDFLDAVGHVDGAAGVVHPVDQDRELVAAQPRHGVAGAEKVLEPAGDAHQQLVADRVAEAVVDVLEAVEVEKEDREVGLGPPLQVGQSAGQTVQEEDPVGEPGQTVVEGVVLQLVLGPFAVRDVGLRTRHAVWVALVIAHRDAARQHPADTRRPRCASGARTRSARSRPRGGHRDVCETAAGHRGGCGPTTRGGCRRRL